MRDRFNSDKSKPSERIRSVITVFRGEIDPPSAEGVSHTVIHPLGARLVDAKIRKAVSGNYFLQSFWLTQFPHDPSTDEGSDDESVDEDR